MHGQWEADIQAALRFPACFCVWARDGICSFLHVELVQPVPLNEVCVPPAEKGLVMTSLLK